MNAFSSRVRIGLGWHKSLPTWIACGLCTALGAGPALAGGSWHWIDEQGRKVYSDMPPPVSVPERRILQRPEIVPPVAASPEAPPAVQPTPPDAGEGKPATADAPRERPLYQRNEEALRENCRRARAALQTLNSGLRLQVINDKGEQVEMDAALRAQEIRRTQQEERDNCAPDRRSGKP